MMTTTIDHQWHEINSADARRRKIRVMQAIFAGAATIATLTLYSAAWPGDAETVVAPGSVRLVDQATDLPAPAPAAVDPQFPQTLLNQFPQIPQTLLNAVGDGGFAADSDDNDDSTQQRENEQQDELNQQQSDQNEDEANQATQQAEQQMQQSDQEAEEQNEMAEQQAQQDEQQAQMDEQRAGQ
jgi:flagellar biosynthesis GTPase FlhF